MSLNVELPKLKEPFGTILKSHSTNLNSMRFAVLLTIPVPLALPAHMIL